MRALSLRNGELIYSSDQRRPDCAEDEVLVQVTQAGICETDIQLAKGYMEFDGILGHEFVGVAQSGPLAGCRVVGEINCNCRRCPQCDAGLGNHCPHRTVIGIDHHDGAFADFVAIPQHNLHEIPDGISDDEAVFIEPLAAAFEILEQVEINRAHRVAICGDGRLALMCAKAIHPTGAEIHVVGKHWVKLARFESVADHTALLDGNLPQQKFDVIIDCTGSASGLPLALKLVRPRGTVVMKTTVAHEHQLSLAPLVINEINVVGSRCGPFDVAVDSLANDEVNLNGLISHRFPLEEAVVAMRMASSADAFKIVLRM